MATAKKVTDEGAASLKPPAYWEEACKHLVKKDRVMRRLIPELGNVSLTLRGDAFTTLARSIVGQQVSVASAQRVWEKFALLPPEMSPGNVLRLKVDDMRATGLSTRKVEYLVDLALHFDSGRLHFKEWDAMDDDAIVTELVAIRGISRWTADMCLLFHLGGQRVLALVDARLVQGVRNRYFSGEPVSRSDAREVAEAWKPWCSVASWYIWRSLAPMPVQC